MKNIEKRNQIVSIGLDFKEFGVEDVDYLDFLSTESSIKEEHRIILYFPRFSNYKECKNKEEIITYWKKELGRARSGDRHIVIFLFEPWQFVDEQTCELELLDGFSLKNPKISYSSDIVKKRGFLGGYWNYAKDESYALMSFEESEDYTEIFFTPQQKMVGCLSNDKKILFLPLCDILKIIKSDFVSIIKNIESKNKQFEERKPIGEEELEREVHEMLEELGFKVAVEKSYDLQFGFDGGEQFAGEVKSSRIRIEHLARLKGACGVLKPVLFVDSSRSSSKQVFFSSAILDFAKQEKILLVDIHELRLLIKIIRTKRGDEQQKLQQEVLTEFKRTEYGKVRLLYDNILVTKQEGTSEVQREVEKEEWWKNANRLISALYAQKTKEDDDIGLPVVKLLKKYAHMLDTQCEIIAGDGDFQKIKNIFLAYIFDIFYQDFHIKQGLIVVKGIDKIYMPHNLFIKLLGSMKIVFLHCGFDLYEDKRDRGQSQPYLHFEKCIFYTDLNMGNFYFGKKVEFQNCKFFKKVFFVHSTFSQDAVFDRSIFAKNADFCEASFDKNASFYGTVFEAIPLFSQAIFKEKLNFVDARLDFAFEECERLIYTDNVSAGNLRDSFRILKGKLIDGHNLLDSLTYRKIELYFRELEIRKEINPKKKSKNTICRRIKKMSIKIMGALKDGLKKIARVNFFQKAPQFAEQKILNFYRIISEHHTNLSKSFSSVIFYIVFNCFFIVLIKYVFSNYLLIGDGGEVEIIAEGTLFVMLAFLVASIFVSALCGGIIRKIAFACFYVLLFIILSLPFLLSSRDDSFVQPFVIGIIILYFVLLYFYFCLLEIPIIRSISSVVLYFLFIVFFCQNPYIVAPILENSDKNDIHNYLIKEYVQATDLTQLKKVVKQCEKLDRQIDWSRNQYSQIRQVLLSDSTLFLTDKVCASQIAPNFSIMVFKNWVLNNTLRVIHVVYSIVLAMFLFSLIKTARKNSIVPS